MECLICNKSTKNIKSLIRHVSVHNETSESYYSKYLAIAGDGLCIICGSQTYYRNMAEGYAKYCSRECSAKDASSRTKASWENDEQRRSKTSEFWKDKNNNPSVGRPKGSKNKNAYPKTEAVLRRYQKTPPPSWSGKTHKESTKDKMSETRTSLIKENGAVMAYKGKYAPKYPEKYAGNPDNIVYRSLWERKFMEWCDFNQSVVKWGSEEVVVPYKDPARGYSVRRYFPDFVIQVKTKTGQTKITMIEIKPEYQCKQPAQKKRTTQKYLNEMLTWGTNQAKWEAAEQFCKMRGWEFKVLTEHDLGIKY